MKKGIIIIISVLFLIITTVLLFLCASLVFDIGISQRNMAETYLLTSKSPDGNYTLKAYKTEPGATVDFSVKVYLVDDEEKNLVYNAYHEYEADINWIDNDRVSINGEILNISQGEKYDWRN